MTRAQLEHAIRAACDVADDTELLIFGSQAILGEYPDAHPALRAYFAALECAQIDKDYRDFARFIVSSLQAGELKA